MKALKLSLAAAIAATSLTSLNAATALEESLKDIDVGGVLRYRYDTYRIKDSSDQGDSQNHKIRAQVGAKGYLTDNIAAVGVIDYNYDGNAHDSGYGSGSKSNTGETFHLREVYVQYEAPDFGTTIKAGRQQLNTIWTDNGIDGSVGMKAQIFNNSINGLTLTAFVVDSVNDDGDFVGTDVGITQTYQNAMGQTQIVDNGASTQIIPGSYNTQLGEQVIGQGLAGNYNFADLKDAIFSKNLYGVAGLLDYSEDLGLTGGLWLAYVPERITLYAADAGYSVTFGNDITWGIQGQYLGNNTEDFLDRRDIKNGSLYAVAGTLEGFGFDGTLGYTSYGKKDYTTVNVLEDMGDIITAGEEIQNLNGSSLHGDLGKNQFVFGAVGYTIADKVRLGLDYVYGGTKVADNIGVGQAGKKQEIVARVNYQFSDRLEFYAHYSFVTHKNNSAYGLNGAYDGLPALVLDAEGRPTNAINKVKQNNIRLQAKYEF